MSEDTNATTEKLQKLLDQLIIQQKRTEVATLTSALLGSRRKSLSINELLAITRDIQYALYPVPYHANYQEWEKTKDERLSLIYK